MTKKAKTLPIDEVLELIANTKLDIHTLEERKMDSLDFHEVSVWRLKEALEAAYKAGQESVK